MACTQACDRGPLKPTADYLTRTIVANDNRPPSLFAERLTYAAGMAACFVIQFMWAEFLVGQLRSF
jgi:hypothetical protein